MIRAFFACFALIVVFVGCSSVNTSSVSKSVLAKQEWSENYARAKDVKATSPLMVDGDPNTSAETQLPADMARATTTKFTEAVVELPEKVSVRRVVVKSPNIRNFIVYAATDADWKTLKEFKNSTDPVVDMSVSAETNKIKVRVLRTSDDTTVPGGRGAAAQLKRAPAKIQEIEIYGLIAAKPVQATAAAPGTTQGEAPAPAAPKAPPAAATMEASQNSFPLAGPIPLKINIKIGPDDLVVLADNVSNNMLYTKLLVTKSTGEKIACSKPTPPLSRPMPKRFGDKPVDVRDARTLDADSVVNLDFNLLDYYPIKDPGSYTVQLSTWLEVHENYVGRGQTEKEDLERQIRDINSKSNFTATEKADLIKNLRDDAAQAQKKATKKYIEVNAKGKPLELKSNTLELVIE